MTLKLQKKQEEKLNLRNKLSSKKKKDTYSINKRPIIILK